MTGRGSTDAWTLLGALAGRTERHRLGTLVSPVTFRSPSVLARSAAKVDQIMLNHGLFDDLEMLELLATQVFPKVQG